MPKIAEIREIDGAVWVRLEEFTGESGKVTLWSEDEIEEHANASVRNFLTDLLNQWRAGQ